MAGDRGAFGATTAGPCPCGSDAEYGVCCGPLHTGESSATTAEQLMRSRYAAYVLGEPIAAPERTWKRDGVWETTKAVVTDPGAWRDLVWSAALMPITVATFSIAVTVWSAALGMLTSPLWYWALPDDADDTIPLLDSTSPGWTILRGVIGLVLVPLAIAICRGTALSQAKARPTPQSIPTINRHGVVAASTASSSRGRSARCRPTA